MRAVYSPSICQNRYLLNFCPFQFKPQKIPVKEIRKKIFITLLLLLIFRLGCYIPVPGIDVDSKVVSASVVEIDDGACRNLFKLA